MCLLQSRFDEAQKIVKRIGEGFRADSHRAVTLSLEAHAVTVVIANGFDLGAGLGLAGIEWRVDVDEVEALVLKALEYGQVVAKVDVKHGFAIVTSLTPHRRGSSAEGDSAPLTDVFANDSPSPFKTIKRTT